MRIYTFGVAAVVCACAGAASAGVPTEWTYELQCRSSLDPMIPAFNLPLISSLSSQYVTIDEDGGVAIRVFLGGNPSEGIFYGKDGVGGLVVTGNSGDPIWGVTLDARNGLIGAELGGIGDGARLYDTAGNLVQSFDPGGSEGASGYSGLTITGDGALCYRGDFGFAYDKVVIDEYTPARTQTLVADSDVEFDFIFSPEINDARQVVFNSIPAGSQRRIVRVEPDLSRTTVAQTGAVWSSFVNSVAIAQDGGVGFSARRASDSVWEVNAWEDGGGVTAVASGDDADIQNGSLANFPPVVNSDGWVAFRATDVSNDATAVWVGDGENLVKLAAFDQVIETDLGPIQMGFDFGGFDGKQVANGVVDINDAGQVAFAAFLRNGTIGVFVATPVVGCAADLDGSGALNFGDVTAFLSLYGNGDLAADLDGSGALNFGDVTAFLGAYAAGCP